MRDRLIEFINYARLYGDGTSESIADYLLANGVIVPPCKVGDTVYIIDEAEDECSEDFVLDVEVLHLFVNKHGIALDLKLPLGMRLNTWALVGRNVFLTREEAENALAERRADNDRTRAD